MSVIDSDLRNHLLCRESVAQAEAVVNRAKPAHFSAGELCGAEPKKANTAHQPPLAGLIASTVPFGNLATKDDRQMREAIGPAQRTTALHMIPKSYGFPVKRTMKQWDKTCGSIVSRLTKH